MFVFLMEREPEVYQSGVCKHPEAYICRMRADFPTAEFIWCFPAKATTARRIAMFLRFMQPEDIDYWRKLDPRTVKKWLYRAAGS